MISSPYGLLNRLRSRYLLLRRGVDGDNVGTPLAQSRIDGSRVFVFMHIPKTAGSSMINALVNTLQPSLVVSGFDRVLFGDYDDFASFDPAVRNVVYLTPDALPEADFVVGHISYNTLKSRYPAAQLTTVLREPISRLLSLWIFWRGHDDKKLAEWGSWAGEVKRAREPLQQFLHAPSLACQNDNQVVRMLLSPHALIPANGFIEPQHDEVLLSAAKARLRGFAYADILENVDLREEWQAWMGLPLSLSRLNETSALPSLLCSPLALELTPDAMDWLDRLSRLDLHLWLYLASRTRTPAQAMRLREQALMRNVAHYATIMATTLSDKPATAT